MVTTPDRSQAHRQHRFVRPHGAIDLVLVRHGESAPARLDAPDRLVHGRADPPLDPVGVDQARRLADRLSAERFDALYTTPLRRTAETAAPLGARLGLRPAVEPDLIEVGLGAWEGAAGRIGVERGDPVARRLFAEERWDVIPGAERVEAFEARVRAAVDRIAAAHAGGRVIAVTHGGVIGAVTAMAAASRRFAFVWTDNASITHVVVVPPERPDDDVAGRWIVRRYNDTGHLPTDLDRAPQELV